MLDTPGERSSHIVPTPRGGGAGVAGAAVVTYLLLGPVDGLDWRIALALVSILPTAMVGWLDDHKPLPVLPRFLAHLGSALLLVPLAIEPGLPPTTTVLLTASWVFATVSAINVVNFIDGIDGLIGLQAVVFAVHLVLLSESEGAAWTLGISVASSSAAFLLWNWAPARIFLGDVGSGALAVLGLVGGLLVWRESKWPFIAVFLPLFPIFLDAAVAIARRARKREPLAIAHRTHLYQRIANEGGWGHARVSMLYCIAAAMATVVVVAVPGRWVLNASGLYAIAVFGLGAWLDRNFPSLEQQLRS